MNGNGLTSFLSLTICVKVVKIRWKMKKMVILEFWILEIFAFSRYSCVMKQFCFTDADLLYIFIYVSKWNSRLNSKYVFVFWNWIWVDKNSCWKKKIWVHTKSPRLTNRSRLTLLFSDGTVQHIIFSRNSMICWLKLLTTTETKMK